MAEPPPSGGGVEGGAFHPTDRIEIRLPSRADFLGAVRSVLRGILEECLQVRVPEEDVQRIQIALQEACINVVRHAHRGDPTKPLIIGIIARPDRLVLEIEDFGPGLPPVEQWPPDPDPGNPREGGYGLFILRQTMDEIRSERRNGRHVLTMVKLLPGGGAGDGAGT